jgi:NAD(P)-dependent dehydrogenase (short-subunit alcohol dehydrogenase family)
MNDPTIVVAGATGNLGGRIAKALLERGASVRGLVRHGSARDKLERLERLGVTIANVDFSSASQVALACSGAACVVSALAGLRDVIVEAQTVLLDAAVKAGVPRFIPSDFSIDFTKFPRGENRNLDLRRDFHQRLDKASIRATTIFNGAFAEMLSGQMPLILFKRKRVLYPAWQGMQYMRNMFDGRAKLEPLDNDRHPGIHWTTVREVLSARQVS